MFLKPGSLYCDSSLILVYQSTLKGPVECTISVFLRPFLGQPLLDHRMERLWLRKNAIIICETKIDKIFFLVLINYVYMVWMVLGVICYHGDCYTRSAMTSNAIFLNRYTSFRYRQRLLLAECYQLHCYLFLPLYQDCYTNIATSQHCYQALKNGFKSHQYTFLSNFSYQTKDWGSHVSLFSICVLPMEKLS